MREEHHGAGKKQSVLWVSGGTGAAVLADMLLLITLCRAVCDLGYPGEQSSGEDREVAPWQGKTWKAEWHGAYLERSWLMQHLW